MRFGPSQGEPVNLGTGEEEYRPGPDLTVYNPHGPSVLWERIYNSLRGPDDTYPSDDFGIGWSHSYNLVVHDPSVSLDDQLIADGTAHPLTITESEALPSIGGCNPASAAGVWDITRNGASVATCANPDGWMVTYSPGTPALLQVTVPTAAMSAKGYKVRWTNNASGPQSAVFDVLAIVQTQEGPAFEIPQGAAFELPPLPPGEAEAPAGTLDWQVLLNGIEVGSNVSPRGWIVEVRASFPRIPITPPMSAVAGGVYKVRVRTNPLIQTGRFKIVGDRFNYNANAKKLIFPNGSCIQFTPSGVPSSTQQKSCSTDNGVPLMVTWNFDAAHPSGNYTITFRDGSQWTTTPAHKAINGGAVCYQVKKIVDLRIRDSSANQNPIAIVFKYGLVGESGFPILSQILDAGVTPNVALLTFTRQIDGNGYDQVQATDPHGRAIHYELHKYSTTGSTEIPYYWELHKVSQVVSSSAPSPWPMRWAYGYTSDELRNNVPNGLMGEAVPFLNTIDVPSPTGVGTARAIIAYRPTGVVQYSVGAGGRVRSYYDMGGNRTKVQITHATPPGQTPLPSATYYVGYDVDLQLTERYDGNDVLVWKATYENATNPYRPVMIETGDMSDGSYLKTTLSWDRWGNLKSVTTPRGRRTDYSWPTAVVPMGRLETIVEGADQNPPKATITIGYDPVTGLLPSSITTPAPHASGAPNNQVTTSYQYSYLGNLLSVTRPGNGSYGNLVTTFNYTTDGAYSQPEALGQPLRITETAINPAAPSRTSHLRYDSRGNLIWAQDPVAFAQGYRTDYSYDPITDRLTQVTFPATGQTGPGRASMRYWYDLYPSGPLTRVEAYDEAVVSNLVRQAITTYGSEGQPATTQVRLGDGTLQTQSTRLYDSAFRLWRLTDARGSATQYTEYKYSTAGYPEKITYPGGDTVRFEEWDRAGRLKKRIDGNNVATRYFYEPMNMGDGLLTDIKYPDPDPSQGGDDNPQNVSFAYDLYGRRMTMQDSTGLITYQYGVLDELKSVVTRYNKPGGTLPDMGMFYQYYPNGNRKAMGTPAGNVSYGYDWADRLSGMNVFRTSGFEHTDWNYQDNDWLLYQQLANGVRTTYTLNRRGFLTDLVSRTNGGAGALLSEFGSTNPAGQMLYDAVGNRVSMNANIPLAAGYSGLTNYFYDTKNQLTREVSVRASGYDRTWTYDPAGNPTSIRGPNGPFVYNSQNQWDIAAHPTNQYDGNGNPTLAWGIQQEFDYENHLTKYGVPATPVFQAGYYGDGLRAWKETHSSGRTYFVYDGAAPVVEVDGNGVIQAVNSLPPAIPSGAGRVWVRGAVGLLSRLADRAPPAHQPLL